MSRDRRVDKEYRELLSEYSRLTATQRASSGERVQQQGPPGARERGARAAGGKSFQGLPAARASRSKLNIDTPDNTKGRGEDPKKYSKQEGDEVELKVAEALEDNFENHEYIATAHVYGADEGCTDSEAELEDKEEATEEESSDPEPAWEVSKLAKDAYPKIVDTSHGRKVLLPHSLGGHTCLLCREGGQCLGQQEMQEHLEKKHGRFFKKNWKEFSSFQCRI